MFITLLFEDPRTFFLMVLFVVLSVTIHEYMHAFTALKMGDPTAADNGHLTMNPFKQMGLISLIMLCFIGIAWGQVPVNPMNLNSKKKRILVALSGVLANLGLAVIFTILALLVMVHTRNQEYAVSMLIYGATINVVLLIFNLMPVPGLDGFNVVREFIRINSRQAAERANTIFFVMMLLLLFFGIDYIITLASRIVGAMFYLFANLLGVI
ncbi:MAG: site-2 protease family protein [Lentisphaerae bacterium]|nr:site-2 protease family protein [Lentisphaerota bacterium]